MAKKNELHCTFCGRPESDAQVLLTGLNGYICDACIRQGYEILSRSMPQKSSRAKVSHIQTPNAEVKILQFYHILFIFLAPK